MQNNKNIYIYIYILKYINITRLSICVYVDTGWSGFIGARMDVTPFNSEGGGANPNNHSHNTIILQTPIDVIVSLSISNPSKTVMSCNVDVISPCLRWNVCVSHLYRLISAWIKPWSSLKSSRQLIYKNPAWTTYGWTRSCSRIHLYIWQ